MVEMGEPFIPIFADTGHEHPVTVNYVKNLHIMAGGPEVQIVKADFGERLEKKGYSKTGYTFLDLCLWKGRAPSSKAQFCTEHLKLWPIKFWLWKNYPQDKYEWWMHTGIRAGESFRRSKMQPFMWNDFFDCWSCLPMLYNDEGSEYAYLEEKGVPPNPLYALGYGRVGCFPCIHANKKELSLLPDWAWDRLITYESQLNRSWFASGVLPGKPKGYIPSVSEIREWCKTSFGGKQYDIFKSQDTEDAPSCVTGWSNCE